MTEQHRHVRLTFPPGPATEPVIYEIVTRFGVVPEHPARRHPRPQRLDGVRSRRRRRRGGAAIAWMESIGVDVSPAQGDIVEG